MTELIYDETYGDESYIRVYKLDFPGRYRYHIQMRKLMTEEQILMGYTGVFDHGIKDFWSNYNGAITRARAEFYSKYNPQGLATDQSNIEG